jgi:hypothetical protein
LTFLPRIFLWGEVSPFLWTMGGCCHDRHVLRIVSDGLRLEFEGGFPPPRFIPTRVPSDPEKACLEEEVGEI